MFTTTLTLPALAIAVVCVLFVLTLAYVFSLDKIVRALKLQTEVLADSQAMHITSLSATINAAQSQIAGISLFHAALREVFHSRYVNATARVPHNKTCVSYEVINPFFVSVINENDGDKSEKFDVTTIQNLNAMYGALNWSFENKYLEALYNASTHKDKASFYGVSTPVRPLSDHNTDAASYFLGGSKIWDDAARRDFLEGKWHAQSDKLAKIDDEAAKPAVSDSTAIKNLVAEKYAAHTQDDNAALSKVLGVPISDDERKKIEEQMREFKAETLPTGVGIDESIARDYYTKNEIVPCPPPTKVDEVLNSATAVPSLNDAIEHTINTKCKTGLHSSTDLYGEVKPNDIEPIGNDKSELSVVVDKSGIVHSQSLDSDAETVQVSAHKTRKEPTLRGKKRRRG